MDPDTKRRPWKPLTATEIGKRIGGRVRTLRRTADLGQKELAAAVGVDVATIGRLERGVTIPPVHKLAEIAGALDVPLVDLFTFFEDEFPDLSVHYSEIADVLEPKMQTKFRALLRRVESASRGREHFPWR